MSLEHCPAGSNCRGQHSPSFYSGRLWHLSNVHLVLGCPNSQPTIQMLQMKLIRLHNILIIVCCPVLVSLSELSTVWSNLTRVATGRFYCCCSQPTSKLFTQRCTYSYLSYNAWHNEWYHVWVWFAVVFNSTQSSLALLLWHKKAFSLRELLLAGKFDFLLRQTCLAPTVIASSNSNSK